MNNTTTQSMLFTDQRVAILDEDGSTFDRGTILECNEDGENYMVRRDSCPVVYWYSAAELTPITRNGRRVFER
jgi:hypothetical protein